MNEEEKFDELLSSKLSERDFPFDELNWDEAERLIIAQERRRKITRFALIFSTGLMAGVAIMLPFILNTHNALPIVATNTSTVNRNTPVAQNSVLSPANQPQKNTNNIISKNEKAPLPVQSAFVKKDTRAGIRGSSNLNPTAKTPKKQQSLLVAGINKNNHKLPPQTNAVASAEAIDKKPGHDETINQKESTPSQQIATNVSPSQSPAGENATISNSSKTNKNSSEKTSVSNNFTPPNTIDSGKVISARSPASKTKKDSINASPPLLPGTAPNVTANDNHSANILSVYAGGNYSFGWSDNGDKEGNGITPWGGINFTHYLSGDISASLGAGYSELTNLNKTYTSSIVQYDFGVTANTTTVMPQTVYYIVFPLKIQYSPDNKNMFGIGLNYLLLLTTSSIITTGQQTSFGETTGTSKKQNGYTEGFSNSDIQLTISYTRMLTDRLGINLEYYYDFDDIENNTIPGISQSAKNMGLRLILSYQLMK